MRHKLWKMGAMVERIQQVVPSNLLNNMFKIFTNTGNTLPPGNLRTIRVRHESTALCRWGVFHPEKKRNNDSSSVFLFSLATSSAMYSLSVEGSTGLGWDLGLPFADLDLH